MSSSNREPTTTVSNPPGGDKEKPNGNPHQRATEAENAAILDLDLEESLEELINESRDAALGGGLRARSDAAGITPGVGPSLDPGSGPASLGRGAPGRGQSYRERIGGGGRLVAT